MTLKHPMPTIRHNPQRSTINHNKLTNYPPQCIPHTYGCTIANYWVSIITGCTPEAQQGAVQWCKVEYVLRLFAKRDWLCSTCLDKAASIDHLVQ